MNSCAAFPMYLMERDMRITRRNVQPDRHGNQAKSNETLPSAGWHKMPP